MVTVPVDSWEAEALGTRHSGLGEDFWEDRLAHLPQRGPNCPVLFKGPSPKAKRPQVPSALSDRGKELVGFVGP